MPSVDDLFPEATERRARALLLLVHRLGFEIRVILRHRSVELRAIGRESAPARLLVAKVRITNDVAQSEALYRAASELAQKVADHLPES